MILKSKTENFKKFLLNLHLTEKIFFLSLFTVFLVSLLNIILQFSNENMVEVPKDGGTVIEGVVGSPRFINPLLSLSQADKDLTKLIYSGLLKYTPDGNLVNDLAEEFHISDDGKGYYFKLKDNIKFHNGEKITTDDVIFTIEKAMDPTLKSPKRANFSGVKINKINDKEVEFVLKQPYAPFVENLTIGILPSHLWKEIPIEQFPFSEFNINPIGSGPFQFESLSKNKSGIIESIKLNSFSDYTLGSPHIKHIIFKFYPNETSLLRAFKNKDVDNINSISTKNANLLQQEGVIVGGGTLPRVFALFFNQNSAPVLANKEVRVALEMAVNKKRIIKDVLWGFAKKSDGPLPINSKYYTPYNLEYSTNKAIGILEKNGWQKNKESGIMEKKSKSGTEILKFSISAPNNEELITVANYLKEDFLKIGADVDIKIFDSGDLNQNVIRPRDYDALLFGEIIDKNADLFAFWHSSQRNDPGLNIAMYANITVDHTIEKMRKDLPEEEKVDGFKLIQKEIRDDTPAIFLYSPQFIYITDDKIKNINIKQILLPAERFLNVNNWYKDTQKVWKIFTN